MDHEVIILTLFSRWAISMEHRRPSRLLTRHPHDPMTLDQEDARLNSSTCLGLVKCLVFCFLQYIYIYINKNILYPQILHYIIYKILYFIVYLYALTDENKAILLLLLKLVRFISDGSSVGKRIYDVTLYYIMLRTEIHHVTRRNARHWRKLGHVTSLSYNSSGDNVTSHMIQCDAWFWLESLIT